jgi:group I intron endonuclease
MAWMSSSDKKYIVYLYTFPNGKKYCGQTSRTIEERKRSGYHYYIGAAIEKYGWDNIKIEILKENLTKKDADDFEKFVIKSFDLRNREKGYNLAEGGDGGHTREMTDDARKQYKESMLNFWASHPEAKEEASKKQKIALATNNELYQKHIKSLEKTHYKILKPVQCFDMNGNLVGEWNSAREAERFFNTPTIHFRGISATCCGRQKSHGGYIWKFKKEINEEEEN